MTERTIVDLTPTAQDEWNPTGTGVAASAGKSPLMEWFAELMRGPMVRDAGYFERLAVATAASAPNATSHRRSCAG